MDFVGGRGLLKVGATFSKVGVAFSNSRMDSPMPQTGNPPSEILDLSLNVLFQLILACTRIAREINCQNWTVKQLQINLGVY